MAINRPLPTTLSVSNNRLFAAVDMGTNSFKLLIVRADPSTGRFLTVDRFKEPVVLGRDTSNTLSAVISSSSQIRAVDALRKFKQILHSHRIPSSHLRLVATSAVREASNQLEFVAAVNQALGFEMDVLSGFEEARLTYIGVLQFNPVYNKTVLTIDIGGGSTEFVIGKEGNILFGTSLKLGHVTLTQKYATNNEIDQMRERIRSVIQASGLIENVAKHGPEVVIGSSGTIRAIEKAVFFGYAGDFGDSLGMLEGNRRDWAFSREELKRLVEKFCDEQGGVRIEGVSKSRSEFIVAGAILLEEIFGLIGIEEMEVSGFALGEGVIAEKLAEVFDGYDLNMNARWRSVVRLSSRFNNRKMMKSAALCAGIAKEIYEGLRKWNEAADDQTKLSVSLDDNDLEYLEAACLLHNIGMFTGKKGYHKQSYRIITNGAYLHGYNDEEVKLIALLVRHHRKKIPKFDHKSLAGFTNEAKQKFRVLCTIIRLSAVVLQYQPVNVHAVEFSHSDESFKLVVNETIEDMDEHIRGDIEADFEKELQLFRKVFQQKMSITVPPNKSQSSEC